MKQMEHSSLWLVIVQWGRAGKLKSHDKQPTVNTAIARDTSFIASGRRNECDNYLFPNRTDAESFKERIEENLKQEAWRKWKTKAAIVEVTPEDVAHLDLDPAHHTSRITKA